MHHSGGFPRPFLGEHLMRQLHFALPLVLVLGCNKSPEPTSLGATERCPKPTQKPVGAKETPVGEETPDGDTVTRDDSAKEPAPPVVSRQARTLGRLQFDWASQGSSLGDAGEEEKTLTINLTSGDLRYKSDYVQDSHAGHYTEKARAGGTLWPEIEEQAAMLRNFRLAGLELHRSVPAQCANREVELHGDDYMRYELQIAGKKNTFWCTEAPDGQAALETAIEGFEEYLTGIEGAQMFRLRKTIEADNVDSDSETE